MRRTRATVPTLADDGTVGGEQHAANPRVLTLRAPGGKLEGTPEACLFLVRDHPGLGSCRR